MPKNIVIFSTKGGVGKTLISTNLALSLSLAQPGKVLLADLDLNASSDSGRMLGLNPQKAIVDFSPKKEEFITKCSKNLDFVPAILKTESVFSFDTGRIKDLFTYFGADYEFIVIDAGKTFNESLIKALEQAHLILLVTTPDVLSVQQAKQVIVAFELMNLPSKMIRIVLNRAESVSAISWQEIRVALDCEIIAQLPSEGRVAMEAVNLGKPIVTNYPRSKFAVNINKLAKELINNNELFSGLVSVKSVLPAAAQEIKGSILKKLSLGEKSVIAPSLSEAQASQVSGLKRRIHERLIEDLNLKRIDLGTAKELREKVEKIVPRLLFEEGRELSSSPEIRQQIIKEIIDEAIGLGPLEDLLRDENITDIMVNNKDRIYIERNGKIELTDKSFISNAQIKTVIERILAPIGRRIDESMPLVDARLPSGSRVNAIISPLALTGPTLTIRKFREEKFKVEELVKFGTLNAEMAQFLKACVVGRKNMIVSGGTGSGKTTILNLFSGFIPESERIITIEDAAELKLDQGHWVRLESKPPNIEGKGAIGIRDLFRNTLRMRPDRIIVGECRSVEALDMLQAMNTGHDGSMTTLHANSTHDVLTRLDSMILMSGVELPIRAIREMIASALDIIVQTARLSDGSRKITQVTEISGMSDEVHVNLKDIFIFHQKGLDANNKIIGDFEPTGYIPPFVSELKTKGINLSEEIFQKKT